MPTEISTVWQPVIDDIAKKRTLDPKEVGIALLSEEPIPRDVRTYLGELCVSGLVKIKKGRVVLSAEEKRRREMLAFKLVKEVLEELKRDPSPIKDGETITDAAHRIASARLKERYGLNYAPSSVDTMSGKAKRDQQK